LKYFTHKTRWKIAILLIAFSIVLVFLKVTKNLVESLSIEERKKVELWAKGIKYLVEVSGDEKQDVSFVSEVILTNTTIPVILTDSLDQIISFKNIDTTGRKTNYLQNAMLDMKAENEPIVIHMPQDINYVYYQDSIILLRLSYYPYVQLTIIALFFLFFYLILNAFRNEEQNKVWVGLSKETAHQLGTPTSSLLAWVEILKSTKVEENLINELEKDVGRLEVITDRFSKIGSQPSVKEEDILVVLNDSVSYIKKRSSNKVQYEIIAESDNLSIPMNKPLFEWVIENLLKNAIDAMNGNGKINIKITDNLQVIFIDIADNGKGISKNQYKTIFKPGFTTKERGWGLGLSLSKRIIEKYHFGKIFVKESEIDRGTCFRIVLKKNPDIKI